MRTPSVVSILVFAACGFPSLDLSEHPCPCDDGFVCDESRDRCVRALGGRIDGGIDAGRTDGGIDGGETDGNIDAGETDGGETDGGETDGGETDGGSFDGGIDAGVDAGRDAGPMTPGESCYAPLPLTLSSGRVYADGSLSGFEPTYDTACEPGLGGRDLVYYVNLGVGTFDIEIVITPSTLDSVVAVSAECDGLSSDTFLGCNDDWNSSYRGSRMLVHRWAGPHLFVLVKGHEASTTGTFGLDIEVSPAVDSSTCGASLDLSSGGTLLVMPRAGTGTLTTTCGGSGTGAEDVFRLSTDPSGYMEIFGNFGSTFRALALVDRCDAGRTQHWCEPAMRIGGDWGTRDYAVPVPGSPSYLVVDGAPADGGEPYSIDVNP